MADLKIFVVDDDRDFAEGLADILELRGYQVDLAFSGEEALRRFTETDYDVVFMDVRLPSMNGVESFREMRRIRPGARIAMMTGYSMPQLLDEALEEGAWAILQKPFEMEEVLEMVRQVPPSGVVLIADDDPDFAAGVKELLEGSGYTTRVAPTGEKALDLVRSGCPIDVLVLDLRLPVMNGLEVFLACRDAGYHLSTVVVTAYPEGEGRQLEALREHSVTGVLIKPFDPSDLLRIVAEITGPSGRDKS